MRSKGQTCLICFAMILIVFAGVLTWRGVNPRPAEEMSAEKLVSVNSELDQRRSDAVVSSRDLKGLLRRMETILSGKAEETELTGFVDGLSAEEAEMLTRHLLGQSELDLDQFLPLLVSRWADSKPRAAVSFVRSYLETWEASFKKIRKLDGSSTVVRWSPHWRGSNLLADAYRVWARNDSRAAWKHCQRAGPPMQNGNSIYVMRGDAGPGDIMKILAREYPEFALTELEAVRNFDDWAIISKAYVSGLSKGWNWAEIHRGLVKAKNLKNEARQFTWESVMDGYSNFPSPYIADLQQRVVARWMAEDPEQALSWYEKKVTQEEKGDRTWEHRVVGVVLNWHEREEAQAENWIKEQMLEGENALATQFITESIPSSSWPISHETEKTRRILSIGREISESEQRFKLMQEVAKPSLGNRRSSLRIKGSGVGAEIGVVRELLPTFGLSKEQEQEVLQILDKREQEEKAQTRSFVLEFDSGE